MSLVTGVTMKVLLNQYDLSGYFRSVSPTRSVGMYDTTVFGSTQKQVVPGFADGSIEVEGFYEDAGTADAPDNVFAAIEGASTPPIVSVAPEGLALGRRIYMMQANEARHDVKAKVDDLVLNSATFQNNGGFDMGVSLHALSAETSFPFTGTAVDNLALSSNGGVAFLHVKAIAGAAPNAVVKIQHAAVATYADLVTFTANTVPGFERIVVAPGTTVNRNVRITITEGGTTSSITLVVGFARRY